MYFTLVMDKWHVLKKFDLQALDVLNVFAYTWDMLFHHRYTKEIREPALVLFQHGVQIGGLQVFPLIKITVAHVTCIFCGLCVKINTSKTWFKCRTAREDRGRIFACVVGKNLKTPQFEPHGWRRHYTGWYTRSGIYLPCIILFFLYILIQC